MTILDPADRSLIDAALAASDIEGATKLAADALRRGVRDPLLFRLVAHRSEQQGDFQQAHALLFAAVDMAPDDVTSHVQLGALLRKAGDRRAAVRIFDALIARGVDNAAVWLERGYALHAGNSFRDANASYRRAAAADPESADALAGVAETAMQLNDRASAEAFAHDALVRDPANAVAAYVLAQLDLDDGKFAEVQPRLGNMLRRPDLSESQRIEGLTLLGNALDRAGEIDRAFAAFSDAQARYRRLHAPTFGDEARGQTALINHVREQFGKAKSAAWQVQVAGADKAARKHIFLLGYPRSGTTLVEAALTSLADVVAVEEKPTLADTEQPFLGARDGMKRLADISATEAEGYRDLYWDRVSSFSGDVADKCLIDMDPLKGISLPVIGRFFPHARIIVMRRDPRDVIWSCFRQNFHPTPAGYAFSHLESAARHYDALMSLMQDCLDRLPIDPFILRYDALVADFEGVTRRLCDFAGLDWSPAVMAFDRVGADGNIGTASVRQVRKGLFDGTGQWRRYRDHLAPILPILQPWVKRFGFED